MKELNIGGHLSLGRSPRSVVRWAAENDFGSMQIFASSPGAWKPPVLDAVRVRDLNSARKEHGVDPLFIHAIYLINLASDDAVLARRAQRSLVETLEAGDALNARAVVTHIGSHGGKGFDAVAPTVARRIMEVVTAARGNVQLALENSAGSGGIVGARLSELGDLLERCHRHPRLRVALDTAHLCGSGWDFSLPWMATRLVCDIERYIGLDRLVLIHSNDSKVPCGSRKDRHGNIGDGYIGLPGFRNLMTHDALTRVPWILETPDLDHPVQDRVRLQRLARCEDLVTRGSDA
ncbi:MAG: deoxyribonuclease IV [Chloroflexota bacterium]